MCDRLQRWERESDLVNHRLTWLGITQTILFTAFGLAIQQKYSTETYVDIAISLSKNECLFFNKLINCSALEKLAEVYHDSNVGYINLLENTINIVCLLGLTTSMVILYGILGALIAKNELIRRGFTVTSEASLPFGWICQFFIPFAFVVSWEFAIFISCTEWAIGVCIFIVFLSTSFIVIIFKRWVDKFRIFIASIIPVFLSLIYVNSDDHFMVFLYLLLHAILIIGIFLPCRKSIENPESLNISG